MNTLYDFVSKTNQMIVKMANEQTLLKEACKIAVKDAQFGMAWIGIINKKTRILDRVIHEGVDKDFLSILKTNVNKSISGKNDTNRTMSLEGRTVASNDIEAGPIMKPWRTELLKRGYLSVVHIPIKKSGKVFGSFNLYTSKKNFFGPNEIALLERATSNISVALDFLKKEKSKEKGEYAKVESSRRYETLAEISPVGIFHTDKRGYTTYVNPRWCQISGMSCKDALGNGWRNAVHEEDRKKLIDGWIKATKDRKLSVSEYRFVHPDGSIAWVIGQAVPEINSHNIVVGYVGTITDITERKKIENEILKEKQLSDSIINSLPGVFYLYTRKGKFLRWNKNFEKITKYSSDEIRNMAPIDFFYEDEKELVAMKIANTFIYGDEHVEANFLLKTKEKIPFYFTGIAIAYEGNECLIGVGVDISDRIEAQKKIKDSAEKLRQLALHLQTIREEERKRIGREIHDELGQQLTAIKMDVAWIDKNIPDSGGAIKTKLKNIIELLDGSNKSIRRILSELRSGILNDHNLLEAIERLGKQFTINTGVPVKYVFPENEIQPTAPIANCIFRLYQEAFTNITRYAHAKQVLVTLTILDQIVKAVVEDNGVGFDPESVQSKSLGILGMKERVLSLGGTFELMSSPGNGTKITIQLPYTSLNKP